MGDPRHPYAAKEVSDENHQHAVGRARILVQTLERVRISLAIQDLVFLDLATGLERWKLLCCHRLALGLCLLGIVVFWRRSQWCGLFMFTLWGGRYRGGARLLVFSHYVQVVTPLFGGG